MEVVLPAEMSVQQSHDISLELQHKVRSTRTRADTHLHPQIQPCTCFCTLPGHSADMSIYIDTSRYVAWVLLHCCCVPMNLKEHTWWCC